MCVWVKCEHFQLFKDAIYVLAWTSKKEILRKLKIRVGKENWIGTISLFLSRKTMGTKPASGLLLLLLFFFTTCHTFENIFYIVSSVDKQIFIQVCGSTLLHELIFLWFVGHFYVAFTENSLKWIIFEKPVGFYNSLVLFPIRVIYSTAILNQGGLGALTSNKLWLLSCKARPVGQREGREGLALNLLCMTGKQFHFSGTQGLKL